MSGMKRILSGLAVSLLFMSILVTGGCTLSQILAAAYAYPQLAGSGVFAFPNSAFAPFITPGFNPGVVSPTFNTMPGSRPQRGAVPNVNNGTGTIINMGMTTNVPPLPNLGNGMSSGFGGGSITGPMTMGNSFSGFQDFGSGSFRPD